MICEAGDVAVVPFPFSERPGVKRRPALILSGVDFNRGAGHSVLAMITTRQDPPWPGDIPIQALAAAGLRRPCIVRLKLFTIDNRLLLRRSGRLSPADSGRVAESLRGHLRAVQRGSGPAVAPR